MFALINQGQLYTDSAGYPVKIIRCINNTVLYRRMDGRTQSVKINDFNEMFELWVRQRYGNRYDLTRDVDGFYCREIVKRMFEVWCHCRGLSVV